MLWLPLSVVAIGALNIVLLLLGMGIDREHRWHDGASRAPLHCPCPVVRCAAGCVVSRSFARVRGEGYDEIQKRWTPHEPVRKAAQFFKFSHQERSVIFTLTPSLV